MKVFPMVDKIMVKENSAKKAVMVSKVLLKDYLTADIKGKIYYISNPLLRHRI